MSLLQPLARVGGLNFRHTFFLLLLLTGCKQELPREPAIGEAYAGPGSLAIRQDIGQQSPVVATVTSGARAMNSRDACNLFTTWAKSGRPAKPFKILPGKREEPTRAWITMRVRTGGFRIQG